MHRARAILENCDLFKPSVGLRRFDTCRPSLLALFVNAPEYVLAVSSRKSEIVSE